MPLTAGAHLGPYEILGAIGAGGMGEVYRARDTKLDRDVAIKVLPESVAADPERLARFEREAKTLASLNHPHIAHIYGLEEANPSTGSGHVVRALVMELVEGPTLADRIAQWSPCHSTKPCGSRNRSPTRSRPRTSRDRSPRSEAGEHQGRDRMAR